MPASSVNASTCLGAGLSLARPAGGAHRTRVRPGSARGSVEVDRHHVVERPRHAADRELPDACNCCPAFSQVHPRRDRRAFTRARRPGRVAPSLASRNGPKTLALTEPRSTLMTEEPDAVEERDV